MRSQMASARSGSDSFSGQPGMSSWEQKIVEIRLYRDSTISNKSLASISFRGLQRPFVNNEQGVLLVLCYELADHAFAPGNLELHQKIREPDVFYRIEPPCCGHAQSAGKIGLAAAGGSQLDDVVVLLDVVAGAEP